MSRSTQRVLDRTRSFKNRLWSAPGVDPADIRAIVRAGVPHGVAPVLAGRGLTGDAARAFLSPSLTREMPAPGFLRDLDAAADRLVRAIRSNERVTIYGDYDVDGATSTAILVRYLRAHGLEAGIYIPDRFAEGYGPNVPAMDRLADAGTQLVVFVDSGTVAFEPIARAHARGMEVLVVDHHSTEREIPDCVAVVNPNRGDQTPGLNHLCAAGLAFLVAQAVDSRIGPGKADLMGLLDLVALGTVADVVPLTGLNRAFVARGLEVMARRGNEGLSALMDVAQLEGEVRAHHCGFVLGPRVNAGGRMADSSVGARLLSSLDPAECLDLAQTLDANNRERQKVEADCTALAVEQIEAGDQSAPALFALGQGWHEGVIGIVASRLKEAYDRPSFVLSQDPETGAMKGSARSMNGFDLGACVLAARAQGLLTAGGGHPMAAGVSLKADKLDAFKAFVREKVAESDFAETGVVSEHDCEIDVGQVTVDLARNLEAMAPFGVGAPKPRFLMRGATLRSVRVLQDRKTGEDAHLKLDLVGSGGRSVKAIAFKIAGTPLFEGLRACEGRAVDLSGTLSLNEWQGRVSAEIAYDDARPAA